MQSLSIMREEITRLASRRLLRIAVLVIACIPLLYGGLYLWSAWDPYASVDRIPVAIVNLDRPARADGATIDAGAGLQEKLLERGTMDWHVVSTQEAQRGIEDGDYYLSLTIPGDFSANLATANTSEPVPARITVTTHEAASLIASQIGERVFAEVRASASASSARTYADRMLLGFGDLRSSLTEAALGADDLHAGLKAAGDGATALALGAQDADEGGARLAAGLTELAAGTAALDTGAGDLADGTSRLTDGLGTARTGAHALSAGTARLADGSAALADGTESLATGASKAMIGATALAQGAAELDAGVQAAIPGLIAAASGAASVGDGSAAVYAALQAYASAVPSATTNPYFQTALGAAKPTADGARQLAAGLAAATSDLPDLAAGAHALAVGSTDLSKGVSAIGDGLGGVALGARSLAGGARAAASGSETLADGVASAHLGALRLDEGASALKTGADELAAGALEASAGVNELSTGLGVLAEGGHDLAVGLSPAIEGSNELASGLTAGVAGIPSFSTTSREANAAMIGDPIRMDTERIDPVPNYGTGFAPYFMSLALWVGALMVYFLVNPISSDAVLSGKRPIAVALGGFLPAAAIGVVQAAIMALVLEKALGLEPVSTPALIGFGALVAVAYVAILQWLSSAFGVVGKFISLVLLMMQLSSAAGTFPVQTLPAFFRAVNPYMPMTYAVAGFRQVISGGDWSALAHDSGSLVIFLAGALALTAVTAWRARDWDPERLKPVLEL